LVEKANFVYSAGFFITVSPPSMDKVAEHCLAADKTYCLNLAAPFILQVPPFKEQVMKLMPFVDYLFGNETEALTFAETEKWETKDLKEIACKLSELETKKKNPRTVVITQGADPTIVAVSGKATEYPIIKLEKSQLVDTNGAGDAYVGGFLAKLVQEGPLRSVANAGLSPPASLCSEAVAPFPRISKGSAARNILCNRYVGGIPEMIFYFRSLILAINTLR